jgi:hypothetical protein
MSKNASWVKFSVLSKNNWLQDMARKEIPKDGIAEPNIIN